jgi:hypothetical protein
MGRRARCFSATRPDDASLAAAAKLMAEARSNLAILVGEMSTWRNDLSILKGATCIIGWTSTATTDLGPILCQGLRERGHPRRRGQHHPDPFFIREALPGSPRPVPHPLAGLPLRQAPQDRALPEHPGHQRYHRLGCPEPGRVRLILALHSARGHCGQPPCRFNGIFQRGLLPGRTGEELLAKGIRLLPLRRGHRPDRGRSRPAQAGAATGSG